MSEPKTRASRIDTVVPGILHWGIRDERIQFRSDAYALKEGESTILIDPLPLEEHLLKDLGKVEAVCLTGACHQRASWRYRKQLGVKVHAPKGAATLEEEPDAWYEEGQELPGGLKPVHSPGLTDAFYSFLSQKGEGTLFCSDILVIESGKVGFVPESYMEDPARVRASARRYLDLNFGVLCSAHGDPLTSAAMEAVRQALEADAAG